jgi:hypothetical protein
VENPNKEDRKMTAYQQVTQKEASVLEDEGYSVGTEETPEGLTIYWLEIDTNTGFPVG